jgi:RNA polymerase sigma factor (sigma-70 family)
MGHPVAWGVCVPGPRAPLFRPSLYLHGAERVYEPAMNTGETRASNRGEAVAAARVIELQVNDVLREQSRARIGRLVASADEAQDLTQESLLRVVRGLPQFRGDSSLKTWALRIAGNVVTDSRRRAARRPAERDGPPSAGDLDDLEQTQERSPEDELQRSLSADCLRAALNTLSESYRQVFELHDLAGFSSAEIAELLDVPVSTVKIRLHRSRRRLQILCEAGCQISRGGRGDVTCEPRDENSR